MGVCYAVLAYLFWGLAPIYWKLLADVPSLALIAHRVVWSLPLLLLLIVLRRRLGAFASVWREWRLLRWHLLASVLLAVNWFTFVWAVAQGRVVEVSFAYFLCPLLSVLLGCLFERERLQRLQVAALGCAAAGIAVLAVAAVNFPVAGLLMASSWAIYGLLKKRAALGALSSLGVEASLLFVPAILFLVWSGGPWWVQSTGPHGTIGGWLLIASTGLITTIPLLLFAEAAVRVRLSTMGVLQYLVPSLNLIIAVGLFQEPFTLSQAVAFVAIWIGLGLYALGSRRPVGKIPTAPGVF